MSDLLPTIKLGPHEITRLIIGGNPFSGGSHTSQEMDTAFMDYYTNDNIKAALFEAERQGLNCMQTRADRHIMRANREYRNEGGQLKWIAQTASEHADIPGNIRQAAANGAIAIYHHGSCTDAMWREGRIDEIVPRLDIMRECGVVVGLGSHHPEVIEYAEEHEWNVDFYMTCFYTLGIARPATGSAFSFVGGEIYDDADRERMTAVMRATEKPCLGFKILAASRKCESEDTVREAFKYAFGNIKPTDAVVVGMFQRDLNQFAMNAALAREFA